MKLAELLPKIPGLIAKGISKVGKWILNTDIWVLGKAGIFVGAALAALKLILKFVKDRKQAFMNEEEKTPVDDALGLGYNRTDSLDGLHPKMSKLRKAANGVFRSKKKHGKKNTIWELSQKAKERRAKQFEDQYEQKVNSEYEQFLKDWPLYYANAWDPCLDDHQTLYRIWHGTDECW